MGAGKKEEVSNVVGDLGSLVKDKRSTWQKSCTESLKREKEVRVLAAEVNAQGSVDENTRAIIIRGLDRIRKIREEETLRELLDEVLDRRKPQEDEMWKELEDHMANARRISGNNQLPWTMEGS